MNTDREQMELAAKAAGYDLGWVWADWRREDRVFYFASQSDGYRKGERWNPRDDDGDALRLAVKAGICLDFANGWVAAYAGSRIAAQFSERLGSDAYAATRLAIFRAAVEIGRNMP